MKEVDTVKDILDTYCDLYNTVQCLLDDIRDYCRHTRNNISKLEKFVGEHSVWIEDNLKKLDKICKGK